tara:strand:+ start:1001 stop:1393 length:393 start_codon:yes stop_codon:yes gene_type:complete
MLFLLNNIICIFLALIVLLHLPIRTNAISHDWVNVPTSKFGSQLWDAKSVQKNEDGSIRVLSKFVPKISNDITKEILYTMDINCSQKTFRDVGVGAKDFDEFKNPESKWKYPNGDKLILGVIDQVCSFKK